MANYCHNLVTFSGPAAEMVKLKLLFSEMARDFEARNTMGKPDFVTAEDGHMFDISVGEDSIHYLTRWIPNIEVVLQIAEHFGLDYIHQYDEVHTMIYGEASCKNGEFSHAYLDESDYDRHHFNFDTGKFEYNGQEYEDQFAIWDLMLAEKKQAIAATPWMFRNSSSVTTDELTAIYGELLTGNLFLKLAEHGNFMAAKELFDTWDEETVVIMDNFLVEEARHTAQLLKYSREECIALLYLQELVGKYQPDSELKLNLEPGNRPGLKR